MRMDKCMHMRMDMRMDMCTDVCIDICVDMCTNTHVCMSHLQARYVAMQVDLLPPIPCGAVWCGATHAHVRE